MHGRDRFVQQQIDVHQCSIVLWCWFIRGQGRRELCKIDVFCQRDFGRFTLCRRFLSQHQGPGFGEIERREIIRQNLVIQHLRRDRFLLCVYGCGFARQLQRQLGAL